MEQNQNHKKCPFCFEDILEEAIKCKHCNKFINKEQNMKEGKYGLISLYCFVFFIVFIFLAPVLSVFLFSASLVFALLALVNKHKYAKYSSVANGVVLGLLIVVGILAPVDESTNSDYTHDSSPSSNGSYESSTDSDFSSDFDSSIDSDSGNICAQLNCSNDAVSTGDSVYCSQHSSRCEDCNSYIDGDATWCMDCLFPGEDSSNDFDSSIDSDSGNICAQINCSNNAVSTGDSVYCSQHSSRCLDCNSYIDGDATWCMDCLFPGEDSSNDFEDELEELLE